MSQLTYAEVKLQIEQTRQEVIEAVIRSYQTAIEFIAALPLWGFMIVRSRASAEFESWGIPESWADWIAWNLPRRYCVGFVKMIRH